MVQHRESTAHDRRLITNDSTRSAAARAAARALSDGALLDAMIAGDHWAWYEFDARFRPRLERFASTVGIPSADWPECIDDVLEDTAMRWTVPGAARPDSLIRYLIRAVRNRAMNVGRGRRDAATVPLAVFERSLTADDADVMHSAALSRVVEKLRESLTEDEELLLGWVGAGVPYRQIAAWLGIRYDAAAKRIARLNERLRSRLRATLTDEDEDEETRAMIERFLSARDEVSR